MTTVGASNESCLGRHGHLATLLVTVSLKLMLIIHVRMYAISPHRKAFSRNMRLTGEAKGNVKERNAI